MRFSRLQVRPGLGVRERREDRELGQVEVDLHQEVDQPPDVVLGVVVHPEQDRAFDGDPVVVVATDPVADVVRGVEDGLVDVPGPRPGREVEHLGLVLDGVADPLLLQRDHLPEELHLPAGVLGERVVDQEEAVVVDAGHLLDRPLDRPRPELPAAEVGHRAGVAVVAAAARGVDQVHHLDAAVVVEFALQDRAARRAHALDRGPVVEKVVDRLERPVAEIREAPPPCAPRPRPGRRRPRAPWSPRRAAWRRSRRR